MKTATRSLDRILRGDATSLTALRSGTLDLPVGTLSLLLAVLAALYGCCMGWYGLFNHEGKPAFDQMLASMAKVPALFLFTLIVTFPSLYVFNALVGSRLTLGTLVRLLVAAMGVLLAVLASFGPIVAFFSVTTTSHPFVLLLNVAFCAVAGLLGMAFLLQTLHRMSVATAESEPPAPGLSATPQVPPIVPSAPPTWAGAPPVVAPMSPAPAGPEPAPEPSVPPILEAPSTIDATAPLSAGGPRKLAVPAHMQTGSPGPAALEPESLTPADPWTSPKRIEPPGALDRLKGQVLGRHVKTVFRCWVILFALVGSQMSWVLRPFIGKPNEAFHLFEPRQSNFFQAVWETSTHLFGTEQSTPGDRSETPKSSTTQPGSQAWSTR